MRIFCVTGGGILILWEARAATEIAAAIGPTRQSGRRGLGEVDADGAVTLGSLKTDVAVTLGSLDRAIQGGIRIDEGTAVRDVGEIVEMRAVGRGNRLARAVDIGAATDVITLPRETV